LEGFRGVRFEGLNTGRLEGFRGVRFEGLNTGRLEGFRGVRFEGLNTGRLEGFRGVRFEGLNTGSSKGSICHISEIKAVKLGIQGCQVGFLRAVSRWQNLGVSRIQECHNKQGL
jgi:hypothetical protein